MTQFEPNIPTQGNEVWRLAIFGLPATLFLVTMMVLISHRNLNAHADIPKTDIEQRLERTAAALVANPDNIDLRLEQANLLVDLREQNGAHASARSIALAIQTPEHHFQLGRLFMRLGDDKSAIDHFRTIPADNRLYASSVTHLGDAYYRSGQLTAVQTLFDGHAETKERLLIRARLAHAQGYFDRASRLADALIDREPADPRYWALAGDIALDTNNLERASRAAMQMRRADAFVLRADLVDVEIAIREGRFEDANAVLSHMVTRWPDSPVVRETQGFLALNVGDIAQSVERYDGLADRQSYDTMRTLRLVAAKEINGDDVQADLLMNNLRSSAPDLWLLHHLDTERALHRAHLAPGAQAVQAGEGASVEDETVVEDEVGLDFTAFEDLIRTAPYVEMGRAQRLRAYASMGDLDGARRDLAALSAPGSLALEGLATGNDSIFGKFARPVVSARDDFSQLSTLVSALKMRTSGQPEKARAALGTLELTAQDRLYALAMLVHAEIALDNFDDKGALQKLSTLAQTDQVAAASLWATSLKARLHIRASDNDQALALIQDAMERQVPGSLDLLVDYYLERDALDLAIMSVRSHKELSVEPALFYRLVSDCLDQGTRCYGRADHRAALLNDLTARGGQIKGSRRVDAAMIRLHERLAPLAVSWARYRAFYQTWGDDPLGQSLFVDLVAGAGRWKDADRMLSAVKAQEKDRRDGAIIGVYVLAEKMRARRVGRSMRLKSLLELAPQHPLVLNAMAQAVIGKTHTRTTRKAYGQKLATALSVPGVAGQRHLDFDAVLTAITDALGPEETLSLLRTLDQAPYMAFADKGEARSRQRIRAGLMRLDDTDDAQTILLSNETPISLAQAKRMFFAEFERSQARDWAAREYDRYARAYSSALAQTGYYQQALLLARDASLPASFIAKLEASSVRGGRH